MRSAFITLTATAGGWLLGAFVAHTKERTRLTVPQLFVVFMGGALVISLVVVLLGQLVPE